jgi:hypothetical protein
MDRVCTVYAEDFNGVWNTLATLVTQTRQTGSQPIKLLYRGEKL